MIHKNSETVGNIMHQEGMEIKNLKRIKTFSPLIKSVIPTKAGKTMNSVKWKKITLYHEHIWKLKSETVVLGHTRDTFERQRVWRPSLRRCCLCAQIKQERKMYLNFQGNIALSSSHSLSLNDSLSYHMSKMELEIDKMGLVLFFPPVKYLNGIATPCLLHKDYLVFPYT